MHNPDMSNSHAILAAMLVADMCRQKDKMDNLEKQIKYIDELTSSSKVKGKSLARLILGTETETKFFGVDSALLQVKKSMALYQYQQNSTLLDTLISILEQDGR
mgnify:FL=1